MQLVDELSMIYTSCLMAFATFGYGKSKRFQWGLGIGLVGLALGVSGYYHYLQDPAFHQNVYAALTTVIVLRCVWVMEITLRKAYWTRGGSMSRTQRAEGEKHLPTNGYVSIYKKQTSTSGLQTRGQDRRQQAYKEERDAEILRRMWVMFVVGLSTFLLGFWIWHLDNVHCATIRLWRKQLGMPWGFVLEGHAWW